MENVIVSRKFRIDDLDLSDEFHAFRDLANNQVQQALHLPYTSFEGNSLISVKRYSKLLKKKSFGLKERAHRCAAQSSYFMMQQYRLCQRNLIEILNIMHAEGYFSNINSKVLENTSLSYYEMDNKFNFIRNLLLNAIPIDLQLFYSDNVEKNKYLSEVNKQLNNSKFTDKIVKSFKLRAIRKLNSRFKELQNGIVGTSNYDSVILKILKLHNLSQIASVSKKTWSNAKKSWKQSIDSLNLSKLILKWGTILDERYVLQSVFKGINEQRWINGASKTDYISFVRVNLNEIMLKQMVLYYKNQLVPQINAFLGKFNADLQSNIPTMIKIPKLNKTSIPLGIDDDQVYKLEEILTNKQITQVNIKISLKAREFEIVQLRGIDRYTEMIDQGFVAKRGVLSFSHGKYYVHIPFTKKAMLKKDNNLIASADLGLKTLATLSVFNGNGEIDRKFLDQKHMGGPKNNWWTNPSMLNVKGKLIEHRYEARKQQSIRMQSAAGSVRKWFSKEVERKKWRKIRNTNIELVHQISARIVSYLLHHNVSRLILEDLRWSKHSRKSKVGYFLSSYQIHWFFSQVQGLLKNMCNLNGITVELVNPRNSSKECWKCGSLGNRAAKVFVCSSKTCKRYQIDSDLNAARNLVLRSKKYRRLIRP